MTQLVLMNLARIELTGEPVKVQDDTCQQGAE
jgi:hypothetical protein